MADRAKIFDEIITERYRQIEAEHQTPSHDQDHRDGELVRAAACYAVDRKLRDRDGAIWPSGWEYKPKDHRRNVVRAAALLVAELERIDGLGS